MRLITLGLGAALGYLLGSAEGRRNLEKMSQNAQKFWNDPKTQQKVGNLQETAQQKFADVKNSEQVQKATAKVEDTMNKNGSKDSVRDDRVTESNNDNVTSAASHGADPDIVSDPSTPLGDEGPQTR
ncbi:YtxH domain-containing protein [Micrococcus endophyticus]|uniref:YtxH domain-containing protein n=1 Tax=Micrococcus endophyticus TaxID=455343 RepID=UPI0034CF4CB2